MKSDARFWDRIANYYSKKPVEDEAAYKKKLEVTRSYLKPEMDVLEFGCGSGTTALLLAPHVRHIHAIDFSSRMIDICRQKAADQGISNVTFEQVAIEELSEKDHKLDVMLGHSVLHLLDDKEAVLAKVYSLLKPGGLFISSTTCVDDVPVLVKFTVSVGSKLGLLPSVQMFTKEELIEAITGAGFRIDHIFQPDPKKAVFIVGKKSA